MQKSSDCQRKRLKVSFNEEANSIKLFEKFTDAERALIWYSEEDFLRFKQEIRAQLKAVKQRINLNKIQNQILARKKAEDHSRILHQQLLLNNQQNTERARTTARVARILASSLSHTPQSKLAMRSQIIRNQLSSSGAASFGLPERLPPMPMASMGSLSTTPGFHSIPNQLRTAMELFRPASIPTTYTSMQDCLQHQILLLQDAINTSVFSVESTIPYK